MAMLQDVRKTYPEYNDLSDQQLADAIYEAHYKDLPRSEFDAAIGVKGRPTSQWLGFKEGVTKPFDNAARGLEAGARAIGIPTQAINDGLNMPSAADAAQRHQTAFQQEERTRRPGAAGRIVGEVVGAVPTVALRNPFAVNAASGALLSDAKTPSGVAVDAAGSAVLGHVVGKGVDAVADFIKPVIDPAVQMLHDAGVKLTPGMVKGGKGMVAEDKAMSRPVVGPRIAAGRQDAMDTWNTATVNKALEPLGIKVAPSTKPGFDAVAEAHQAVSDAYDQVIPNLAVKLNPQQFAQSVAPAARNLKPAQQRDLQRIVSNELGTGQLMGQQLKDAQSEIRRLAKLYKADTNANNRQLGFALDEVDDHLSNEMMAQNPIWAPQLQRVNTAFRGLATVEDAAGRADDGLFNTGQFKQAVRRGDGSARKNQSAQGQAFMQDWSNASRSVLPARTPNSGTADRLMANNPFAGLKGRLEAMGYNVDNLFQQARLAPRPAAAAPAAQAVKRLKGPVTAGSIAAAHQGRD